MLPRIIKYTELRIGILTLYADNTCFIKKTSRYEIQDLTKNRWLCYSDANIDDVLDLHCDRSSYYMPPVSPGARIYLDPHCKMSRDIVRKDYQITYNWDKADFVLVPNKGKIHSRAHDICVLEDGGIATLISINRSVSSATESSLTDVQWNAVEEFLRMYFSEGCELISNSDHSKLTGYFIPKHETYEEILVGTAHPSSKYMYERQLVCTPSSEISIETLDLWKRMDKDTLSKVILGSDYKKYPMTVCLFLYKYCRSIRWSTERSVKELLYEINFTFYLENDRFPESFVVTPEDWNMWQDWCLHVLGVSEKGGFVSVNDFNKNFMEKDWVRQKFCIAPLKINSAESVNNLLEIKD